MKLQNFFLTAIFFEALLVSCSSDSIIGNASVNRVNNSISDSTGIMKFSSKESFEECISDFNSSKSITTRASSNFESADNLYENSAEGDLAAEKIGFLVPNYKYRHFLNKDMEIIVDDTLYHVTKDGTFCVACSHKDELKSAIDKIDEFKSLGNDLKQLGNVKLINTFGTWNNKASNPIDDDNYFDNNDDDVVLPESSTTRAGGSNELTRDDVGNFPTVGAVNVTILDKILRLSPHYLGYTKLRFKSNSNRKLYVSLYRYDYGFGVSIGLDCKVMKKLWHGLSWGRMVNWDDGIYYGLSTLIIRQGIKQPIFDDFMKNGKALLKSQWESVNNYKFTTYANATTTFNGGIQNQWVTEYNGNPTKSSYVIPIIGERVENILGDTKSTKLAKLLDNFLVKKGISFFSGFDTSNPGKQIQFFSENDRSVYTFYNNDLTWNGGGYRVNDTFLKYYRNIVFGVSLNLGNSSSNLKFNGIKISDNDFVGSPEIFFCEGLVYTKDGDGWTGAKIIKKAPDGSFPVADENNMGGSRR